MGWNVLLLRLRLLLHPVNWAARDSGRGILSGGGSGKAALLAQAD